MSLTDYSLQVGDKFTLTSPVQKKTASAINGQITAPPGPIIGAIPPVDDTSGYWFERLDPNDPTKYQNGTGVMTTTGGNYQPSPTTVGPTSNTVMIPSVWIQDQELEERVRCVLEGKMRRDEDWELLMEEFTIPREESYNIPTLPLVSDRLRAVFPFLRIVDELRGIIYFAWHNGVLRICQPPTKGWAVRSRSYPQIPNAQPYPSYQPQSLPNYPGNAPYPTAPSPYVAPYTWADAAGEQYTLTNASGDELKQWSEVFKTTVSEEYLNALLNTNGSSP